jgi:flagellar secretion chaperone FliS
LPAGARLKSAPLRADIQNITQQNSAETAMYNARTAASPFGRPQAASLYAAVGVETGVATASPHKLVVMLFDGYMAATAQARGALKAGNVEAKGKAIGRAVRIVEEGLKASLDTDGGGTLAADLRDLYAYVTVRLTHANLHNDLAALDECQRLIEPLRDAWLAIGDASAAR